MLQSPGTTPPDAQAQARFILRDRTVERFLVDPYDPEGAMPKAIEEVIGGPKLWADEQVNADQFTPEQRELVLRAFEEIRSLYREAGGRMRQVLTLVDGVGLMPTGGENFAYQSEQWAAARAMGVGHAYRFSPKLPPDEKAEAELTQAYHVVITWIDYVEGGLLDAVAVYENDEEADEPNAITKNT